MACIFIKRHKEMIDESCARINSCDKFAMPGCYSFSSSSPAAATLKLALSSDKVPDEIQLRTKCAFEIEKLKFNFQNKIKIEL